MRIEKHNLSPAFKQELDDREARLQSIETGTRSAKTTTNSHLTSVDTNTQDGGIIEVEVNGRSVVRLEDETTYEAGSQFTTVVLSIVDLKPSTEYTLNIIVPLGERYYANENLFTAAPGTEVGTGARQAIKVTTKSIISEEDINQYTANIGWRLFKNSSGHSSTEEDKKLHIFLGDQTNVEILKDLRVGINSVENPKLVSRGKNLLKLAQGSLTKNGVTISIKGNNVTLEGTSTDVTRFNIQKELIYFTNAEDIKALDLDLIMDTALKYSYGSVVVGGSRSAGTATLTLIKPSGIYGQTAPGDYLESQGLADGVEGTYLYIPSGSIFNDYSFDVSLVKGDSFEVLPYTEDEQVIAGEFHSLPNGVSDDQDYQRVSDVRTYDGSEKWELSTTLTNVIAFVLREEPFTNFKYNNGVCGISDFAKYEYNHTTDSEHVYVSSTGDPLVFIEKNKLSEETVAGFLEYLQGNNISIAIELAEPIKRSIPTNLTSYEGGDIIMTSDSGILPELTFDTPTNLGEALNNVAKSVKYHDDILQAMARVTSAPIELTQDEPVKSVTLKGQAYPKVAIRGRRLTNLIGKTENVKSTLDGTIDNGVITLTADGSYRNADYDSSAFYAGQDCIVRLEVTEFTADSSFAVIGGAFAEAGGYSITPGTTGIITKRFKVKSPLSTDTNTFLYNTAITGHIKYKNFAIYDAKVIDSLGIKDEDIPYLEGTQETQDILLERRNENLFYEPEVESYKGGTGSTIGYQDGKIEYVCTGVSSMTTGRANQLKPNTEYNLSLHNLVGIYDDLIVRYNIGGTLGYLTPGEGNETFTTDNTGEVTFNFTTQNDNSPCDCTFNLMLTEGKLPATQYVVPELEQFFLDEYLGETETAEVDFSKGTLRVERGISKPEKIVEGIATLEPITNVATTKKRFKVGITGVIGSDLIITKPGGKSLRHITGWSDGDEMYIDHTGLYITVHPEDCGWHSDYTPTLADLIAYLYGWVKYNGTDYNVYNGTGGEVWAKRYQGIGTPATSVFGTVVESGISVYEAPTTPAYGDITECYVIRRALKESYELDLNGLIGLQAGYNHLAVVLGIRREKITLDTNGVGNFTLNTHDSNPTVASSGEPFKKKLEEIVQFIEVSGDQETDKTNTLIVDPVANEEDYYYGKGYYGEESALDLHADHYVVYRTVSECSNSSIVEAKATYMDSTPEVIEALQVITHEAVKRVADLEGYIDSMPKIQLGTEPVESVDVPENTLYFQVE